MHDTMAFIGFMTLIFLGIAAVIGIVWLVCNHLEVSRGLDRLIDRCNARHEDHAKRLAALEAAAKQSNQKESQ